MKPWWTYKSGPERDRQKQLDAERRPVDASNKLRNLARKFGLRFDSSIRARIDGDKLILSNGVSEFSLTLSLIDKPYLANVLEILAREPEQPKPSTEASGDSPTP